MNYVVSRLRFFCHATLLCGLGTAMLSFSAPSKATGRILTVSGTPPATVIANTSSYNSPGYYFKPVVNDTSNSPIQFDIHNKPAWAWFDYTNGQLWGRPRSGDVGAYPNITIRVTDWYGSVTETPFTITVLAAPAPSVPANTPPTISGHAPTAVTVGSPYSFAPTAADADKNTLSFKITNKPNWATFSATSGALSGTPAATDVGTYANIQISVSDGLASVGLPAFNIVVNQKTVASATLDWNPPTENTDGSTLTQLAGYKVYYGTSPDSLTHVIQVANPGLTSYVVGNLTTGTWYFAITSYVADGAESSKSSVVATQIM
jgi:hypothetical protein